MRELEAEGGIAAGAARYRKIQDMLVAGMSELGFRALIARDHQSPIITAFHFPVDPEFQFETFHEALKARRFVIYPGKISQAETFRIGTIGQVFPNDIRLLLNALGKVTRQLALTI